MDESRYEKYIVRNPHRISGATQSDTGPIILCAPSLMEGTEQFFEYAIISGDFVAGSGPNNNLRTKSNDETTIFCFLGTNPEDPSDLGAEVEFWLGEGEETEKIIINTPSAVYVPPGVARFPIRWKNVKRPCIFAVLLRVTDEFKLPENAHIPVIWQPE